VLHIQGGSGNSNGSYYWIKFVSTMKVRGGRASNKYRGGAGLEITGNQGIDGSAGEGDTPGLGRQFGALREGGGLPSQ
jgi:hypothetical protein